MAKPTTNSAIDALPMKEIGLSSFRTSSGYVYDDFQKELVGIKGRMKYREMRDTDPTIGGILFAITSIIRTAQWCFDHCEKDTSAEYSAWLEDTLTKMPDMTWDDVVCDALSMITYGFCVQEKVFMRKADGSIGLRKLAPRGQTTVIRFDTDIHGKLNGVWQTSPNGLGELYIPAYKFVHYVTDYNQGNPEGRSLLRNAYKPYHFISAIEIQEAIGVERDLSGMPVIEAPESFLSGGGRASLERLGRDIKFNSQGCIVMPSDVFENADGTKTAARQYDVRLMSSEGGAKIDTDRIINRHTRKMASSILAQFITLGDGKGSYALSENQTDLFLKAIESILEIISQSLTRQLLPQLWELNGFDPEMMPTIRAGKIAPEDLVAFGEFISKISGAGIMINDRETEEFIREKSGLPPAPDESLMDEIDDGLDTDHEDIGKRDKWIDKNLLNRGK